MPNLDHHYVPVHDSSLYNHPQNLNPSYEKPSLESHRADIIEPDDDDRDYFVIKRRPKKHKKRRKPVVLEIDDYDDRYEEDPYIEDDEYTDDQHTDYHHTTNSRDRDHKIHIILNSSNHKGRRRPYDRFYRRRNDEDGRIEEERRASTESLPTGLLTNSKWDAPMSEEILNDDYSLETDDYSDSSNDFSDEHHPIHTKLKNNYSPYANRRMDNFGSSELPFNNIHNGKTFLKPINDHQTAMPSGYLHSINQNLDNFALPNLNPIPRHRNSRQFNGVNQTKTLQMDYAQDQEHDIIEKAVFQLPNRYKRVYSRWSKWSKCTEKCTTRRFK